MSHIRVISNGHGEDLIASRIISALGVNKHEFDVFPLVGNGSAFSALGVSPKLVQTELPSGGFLLRLRDFFWDLRSGLLSQFQNQRRFLNASPAEYQIVVGDLFALFMATFRQKIPTIFFPTAKSERAIPHYALELRYIRKNAAHVFPRDKETHERFILQQIPSHFFGNPMFDAMVSDVPQRGAVTIALLPGSRQEAIQNMRMMLTIVSRLQLNSMISFIFSLSPRFGFPELKSAIQGLPWTLEKDGDNYAFKFTKQRITVAVSYQFFDVLQASSAVIGLAGTANEQAMHAKRHLISFVGSGPQSTKQRFQQQHQLIEGATTDFIDSNDPSIIAQAVSDILNQRSFEWTPLSDHYQMASDQIADYLHQTVLSTP